MGALRSCGRDSGRGAQAATARDWAARTMSGPARSGTVVGDGVVAAARFRVSSLLAVHNLTTRFTGRQPLTAVNDVSFTLAQGRVLVVLGESGSGKSVLLCFFNHTVTTEKTQLRGEVRF